MVFVGRVFAVRDIAYPRLRRIGADDCGGASYANGAVQDTIVAADCYSQPHTRADSHPRPTHGDALSDSEPYPYTANYRHRCRSRRARPGRRDRE
jgi:hypothetical protein